ncbi:hypothetical protein ACQ4PT_056992 [Festuca glaucescens]
MNRDSRPKRREYCLISPSFGLGLATVDLGFSLPTAQPHSRLAATHSAGKEAHLLRSRLFGSLPRQAHTPQGLNMAGLLLHRFVRIQRRVPVTAPAAGAAALFYASRPSSSSSVAHLEMSTRGKEAAAKAELSTKSCVPCNSKDLHAMSEDSAKKSLEQVAGWELKTEGEILKLHRAWKVKNFVKGLEFFQLVAAIAEEEGHHPDLHLVGWNNVKIDVWTHSVRGLTDNDFILAAKINELKLEGLLSKKKATTHE